MQHLGELRAGHRVAEKCLGIHAGFPHQITRQVKPSGTGVLAHIAADIGQLHGHAQISSAGQRRMVFYPHENRHHDADGACDTGAVVADFCKLMVIPSLGVPLKSLKQGVE